jgi:type IV pilus assembly protein PilX
MFSFQMPGQAAGRRARQRGLSLYVILMVVLLSMLLALWAARTALIHEMVVGNDADYQRTFEAAQAMLQDAELDIRHQNPDGSVCASAQFCRTGSKYHLPSVNDNNYVVTLLALLDQEQTKCKNGLCLKRTGAQDFWNDHDARSPSSFQKMIAAGVGARFGQFTGAKADDDNAASILNDTDNGQGAWYWIEILPYFSSENQGGGNALLVDVNPKSQNKYRVLMNHLNPAVIYRITAVAKGRRNALVALQQTYVRQQVNE